MQSYNAPNTRDDHLFILEESIRYSDLEQSAGRFAPLKGSTRSATNAFITGYKQLTAAQAAQAEHEDVAPADGVVQNAQLALQEKADLATFWVTEIRFDALDFARRENAAASRVVARIDHSAQLRYLSEIHEHHHRHPYRR